eukprot:TRINITY_DN12377_c0_g2_i1.p1 TRINITY_DN12377_c0_g2~~TRINITY_DN12377_c0_g2_i1.p1  ORF type:complete len:316 (-),score=51.45 TRINITY_DN12377_c0_g2_i1:157-1104(-)
MHTAVVWAVECAAWQPSSREFEHLLGFCDATRRNEVLSFKFEMDQRRALLSTLLQRKATCAIARADPSTLQISRTRGRKPYAVLNPPSAEAPNFSFNVSHDGNFVAISAHTHLLCGMDVFAKGDRRPTSFLVDTLSQQSRRYYEGLPLEWQGGYAELLFSVKEAYTKAVGVGLGQELRDISFAPDIPALWSVPFKGTRSGIFKVKIATTETEYVANKSVANDSWSRRTGSEEASILAEPCRTEEWRLEVQWIDSEHLAVMAAGCPLCAVDAWGGFRRQFQHPELVPGKGDEPLFSGVEIVPVSYTHLTLPTKRIV